VLALILTVEYRLVLDPDSHTLRPLTVAQHSSKAASYRLVAARRAGFQNAQDDTTGRPRKAFLSLVDWLS
jgi:hypothetical protein